MKTNLLLACCLCLSLQIQAQSGIVYYPGAPTSAIDVCSDGNMLSYGLDYVTKSNLDGSLIWQTPDLGDAFGEFPAHPSPDHNIYELADGRIIVFGFRKVYEISSEGELLSETLIADDGGRIVHTQQDDHGFQILIESLLPYPMEDNFIYKAITFAFEERFSYAFPLEFYIRGMSMKCEGADTKIMLHTMIGIENVLECYSLDTLGTIHAHVTIPDEVNDEFDSKFINDQLYTMADIASELQIRSYDEDFNLLWTIAVPGGYQKDTIINIIELTSGNLIALNTFYEYDGGELISTQKLELFSPDGTHLGSTPEFLRSASMDFYPSDMELIDDNLIAISGSIGVLFEGSYENCIIYVDTTGTISYIYYTGQVYEDANGNGILDGSEVVYPFAQVDVSTIPFPIFSDETGFYSYFVTGTTETVATRDIEPYWDLTDPLSYTYPIVDPALYGTVVENQDFRMSYSVPALDLEVHVGDYFDELPVLDDDTTNRYVALSVTNLGNQFEELSTLVVELEDYMDIQSATPPPTSITGSTVTWEISDFSPLTSRDYQINYRIYYDPALVGTFYTISAEVTTTGSDVYTPNNTCLVTEEYLYAFDPNNIVVYPAGEGPTGLIDISTEWLQYTINFQNTGTGVAHNVVLIDSLDNNIDPASIQILNYSHPLAIELIAPNVYKFTFSDINLQPETINYGQSMGSVTYKAKLNPGLPIGTVITNSAGIYFDLNEPVITNTVMNTLDIMEAVAEPDIHTLSVYPNPAETVLHISIPENLVNAKLLSISSLDGKLVYQQQNPGTGIVEVSVSQLTSGLYIISCDDYITTFIKQ